MLALGLLICFSLQLTGSYIYLSYNPPSYLSLVSMNFLCILTFYLFWDAVAMLSKNSMGHDRSLIPREKRLRDNLEDLFLSNEVSAQRAQMLFQDADEFHPQSWDFKKLKKAGKQGEHKSSCHRDLLKQCLKGTTWPQPYFCTVRVWDNAHQKLKLASIPLLLPHELVHTIGKRSNLTALLAGEGFSAIAKEHLAKVCALMQDSSILGVGFWLDGTPCNWDRSKSVETVSMNMPGLTKGDACLRLPLAVMMKDFMAKKETMDDIMQVLSWSIQCSISGTFPTARHDGSPWGAKDVQRKKKSGQPLSLKSVAVELRADWACLKDTFRLPGWRENAGCCYKCDITRDELRQVGANASWRSPERLLSHWRLLCRIIAKYGSASPIFSMPFFTADLVAIDWLHAVDIGIACDFMGNLFLLLEKKMEGPTQKARVSNLFLLIKDLYRDLGSTSKLDNLTPLMLQKKAGGAPKLRAKAGEARDLVPVAKILADSYLAETGIEGAARAAAMHLSGCYNSLSSDMFDRQNMQEHGRAFVLQCVALEQVSPEPHWRLKPKHHIFLHLIEGMSTPSKTWTYRDEDFGGSIAKLARRRGGAHRPSTAAMLVLNKFRAKRSFPAVL